MEVVELKIIESSIACDYMVIQLNFFWTSLPDALGLSLPIQTNTICTTNQNQNLIHVYLIPVHVIKLSLGTFVYYV